MKAVYSYTIIKYIKSYSTWVILAFSAIVLGFVVGGILPFAFIDVHKPMAAKNYAMAVVGTIAGLTVFFAIFSAIFAGFKSAYMYKDEVENGTFLVVLSKPMRRSQIIFGKWLALQTILVAYSGISVLFLCIGISIFDIGDKISALKFMGVSALKHTIWLAGLFIFAILYLTSLIFSSIGLMLSTKLSTGSTIGLTIAIGVYIPISGLLGMFLRKPEVQPAYNSQLHMSYVAGDASKALSANPIFSEVFPDLNKNLSQLMNSNNIYNATKLGYTTGDTDSYPSAYWLDLDYQFKLLASFAFEKAVPASVVTSLQSNSSSAFLLTPSSMKIKSIVSAKDTYAKISSFMRDFSNVQDDFASASVYQAMLELQPINLKDFQNYFADPETTSQWSSKIDINLITKTIATWLQGKDLSGLSFGDIQDFIVENKALFGNDLRGLIKDFLNKVLIINKYQRDETNFLIKDDHMYPAKHSELEWLTNSLKIIWKYGHATDWSLQNDKTSGLRADLVSQGFSTAFCDFAKEFLDMYYDPSYVINDDQGKPTSEFRNITYGLYKKMFNVIGLSQVSTTDNGSIVKIPTSHILSNAVWGNDSTKLTEDKMRQLLYRMDWWRLWNDKTISSDANSIINSMQIQFNHLLEPLLNLYGNSNFSSDNSKTDAELDRITISTLRKSYDAGYDANKDFNPQKASDKSSDIMSNLSENDEKRLVRIVETADDGNVAAYTSKPYANRNVVIGIYAAIAIGLVPLAYWIVKRQDFR